jgi:hypothetical protein
MRARNIKPGFFENEDLVELPFSCRLFFIGLWCLADRDGRLEDRPKKIKLAIAPLDDVNPDKILKPLSDRSLIVRYSVNGKRYISIPNFSKHQRPHHNEKKSIIPPPPENQPLNDFNLKTLDTAQALIDEKITEDEAGMSKKAAFALLDESTCNHGGKHFALNPDSLNPDSLKTTSAEKPSKGAVKKTKRAPLSTTSKTKALKTYEKPLEEICEKILSKNPTGSIFNPYQFTIKKLKAKIHPGAINKALTVLDRFWDQTEKKWGYCEAILKKEDWNFKDADRIAEGEKDKVDFNKIVKAIEIVMKKGGISE